MQQLSHHIKQWGLALGFQQVGITDADLSTYEDRFLNWLAKGLHGKMDYMEKHGLKRSRPAELLPQTVRIISVRMDYLPPDTSIMTVLNDAKKGYISRYALGRDYHRLMRKRLEKLAKKMNEAAGQLGYRVFCDSAPVLEKPIAEKAGLGWIGKHTNLINSKAGSWFFLGEIYTDLPLIIDQPVEKSHCGSCTACLKICPTQAIIGPYQLDARRCISYLTIELRESIPIELRPLIGNRIYGCDDCQLVCPWNKFAKTTREADFHPRHDLQAPPLLDLFTWTEAEFMHKTEGSAIRRIGYECWLRNIAVALGNAPFDPTIVQALRERMEHVSAMVREHIEWALARQLAKNRKELTPTLQD
ncbi:tRNA epoxyqueuosine(34) reductase QueG [Aquicella lusitana]|uniref:Epoxyqueuosine reductase n=1 Tax=Aquicella lusitana TaxID=254246 RepID=A0A370GCH0_9COXI|nr:tRNA epoxyqueuosine(34) reductase QueG [Aquicella lusitana]RDI41515.1 epoxyqueuosine reductase [Aquicella lusitana]VVC72591.1 Epoxyqueuosine reductase [Aquicella lusitana]